MILGIESSCDDSAVALLDRKTLKLIFDRKISQDHAHNEFGGVVPELAARLHAQNLPRLLEDIKPRLSEVEAIAVTNEPGLTVALAEGVIMAQALSIALKKPALPIHHIKGHICSIAIEGAIDFPLSALMVSGGHTLIIEARSYESMRERAASLDDAFGEAFDKIAKALGLGYPGGRAIEDLAKNGDEKRFAFPIPLKGDPRIAFSFSGLKNAARLAIEGQKEISDRISDQTKADIAASFQKAAIDHLLDKTRAYLKNARPKKMALIGGASANLTLRGAFADLCAEFGVKPLFAPLEFCADNAAMIARAGAEAFNLGHFSDPQNITIRSRSKLTSDREV